MKNHFILKKKVIAFFCKCLYCLSNDSKSNSSQDSTSGDKVNSTSIRQKTGGWSHGITHQVNNKVGRKIKGELSNNAKRGFPKTGEHKSALRYTKYLPTNSQAGNDLQERMGGRLRGRLENKQPPVRRDASHVLLEEPPDQSGGAHGRSGMIPQNRYGVEAIAHRAEEVRRQPNDQLSGGGEGVDVEHGRGNAINKCIPPFTQVKRGHNCSEELECALYPPSSVIVAKKDDEERKKMLKGAVRKLNFDEEEVSK